MGETETVSRRQVRKGGERVVVKLLIDECLHTSLLKLAHEAGHTADHVNYLGLGQLKGLGSDEANPGSGLYVRHE